MGQKVNAIVANKIYVSFCFYDYWVKNKNKNCTIALHTVVVSCFKWSGCGATVAVLDACVNSHRILKLDSNAMHI